MTSGCLSDSIYFDWNATSIMPQLVIDKMSKWYNCGNPSSSYKAAIEGQAIINDLRKLIAKYCDFNILSSTTSRDDTVNNNSNITASSSQYRVIFTSCASESNSTIIVSAIRAYWTMLKSMPHIIISSIEHKSIIMCVSDLVAHGEVEVTMVKPRADGRIHADDVKAAIRSNTALISIMHANNESGIINDIFGIASVAHTANVPFHTDATQTFGKLPLPLIPNIDAVSFSFHKIHGPLGVGGLVIKEQFVQGYKLSPIVYGTQNSGFRGGTENLPAIAGALTGLSVTLKDRRSKNNHLVGLKKLLVGDLCMRVPVCTWAEYNSTNPRTKYELEIVILSSVGAAATVPLSMYSHSDDSDKRSARERGEHARAVSKLTDCVDHNTLLPNTLLISVVKRSHPPVCNVQMKKQLEEAGIIVSIGSACNTSNPKASHVLYEMNADAFIRAGALRISFGDANTADEVKKFNQAFVKIVAGFVSQKSKK